MQNKLKSAFESILPNVGVFFRRQQWRDIFIFIFFVLLAFGFWFFQSLQQDFERRIEFPIRYKNVPVGWILSEDNPKTISILIKEKGNTILYYYLWNVNSHSIDFSVADLPHLSDTSLQITNRMLEAELLKHLSASTSLISFDPREIELRYDILSSRLKPITANVSITPRPGFQLSDNLTISPSEVRLYGSSKNLDKLNEVKTKLIILEDVSKTTELKVQLEIPADLKPEMESVRITIPIEEFTEKKIQLPVQCPDIPANYVLRMFPSKVEITCHLPMSRFRELTEASLEIMIPFAEFENNQATGRIPVKVIHKPAWVTNYTLVPNELEFIIEHHD